MIINCNAKDISDIIDDVRKGKVAYIKIFQGRDGGYICDHKLVNDLTEEDAIEAKKKLSAKPIKIINLMTDLKKISNILLDNIKVVQLSLLFDSISDSKQIIYNFSCITGGSSKDIFEKKKEYKMSDAIDILKSLNIESSSPIPGIYKKVSNKKYTPVQYGELIDIISSIGD